MINRIAIICISIFLWGCQETQDKTEKHTDKIKKESSGKPVNFMTAVSAESELMFNGAIDRAGGINRFDHSRKPATVETQAIVRSQSDMLYSHGVFDAK